MILLLKAHTLDQSSTSVILFTSPSNLLKVNITETTSSNWQEIRISHLFPTVGFAAPIVVAYQQDAQLEARAISMRPTQPGSFKALIYHYPGEQLGISLSSSAIAVPNARIETKKLSRLKSVMEHLKIVLLDPESRSKLKENILASRGFAFHVKVKNIAQLLRNMVFELYKPGGIQLLTMTSPPRANRYDAWFRAHTPDLIELCNQTSECKDKTNEDRLLFVVIAEDTSNIDLQITLSSMRSQTCANFEIIVFTVDDDSNDTNEMRFPIQDSLAQTFVTVKRSSTIPLASEINSHLKQSTASHLVLIKAGTQVAPDLTFHLNRTRDDIYPADIIYTDDDSVSNDGEHVAPYFKPNWSLDFFLASGYIRWSAIISRASILDVGGFDSSFDGDLAFDIITRIVASPDASDPLHIPKVLFHYKTPDRDDIYPQRLPTLAQSQLDSVNIFLRSCDPPASAMTLDTLCPLPLRQIQYALPTLHPLVIVLIPTRDEVDTLRECITTLSTVTDYDNYQVVIVDNASKDPATLDYLTCLEVEQTARVFRFPGEFNYSEIHNWAIGQLDGDFVCLLNNDTSIVDPDWLSKMVGIGSRPDVGIVGVKLLYPDNTIQHCGVVMGIGEALTVHPFVGEEPNTDGYWGRAKVLQDTTSIVAACLLIKRETYLSVGGMDKIHLPISYNDTDLCLRVREQGLKVILDPSITVIHHEGKSRGNDGHDSVKILRKSNERAYMVARWNAKMVDDPFYNPNLSKIIPYELGE